MGHFTWTWGLVFLGNWRDYNSKKAWNDILTEHLGYISERWKISSEYKLWIQIYFQGLQYTQNECTWHWNQLFDFLFYGADCLFKLVNSFNLWRREVCIPQLKNYIMRYMCHLLKLSTSIVDHINRVKFVPFNFIVEKLRYHHLTKEVNKITRATSQHCGVVAIQFVNYWFFLLSPS